jgi:hypothetical protein
LSSTNSNTQEHPKCGQINYEVACKKSLTKAELLQEGIFFLIHLFASDVLVMKELEIKKTKPSFIISVLKIEY